MEGDEVLSVALRGNLDVHSADIRGRGPVVQEDRTSGDSSISVGSDLNGRGKRIGENQELCLGVHEISRLVGLESRRVLVGNQATSSKVNLVVGDPAVEALLGLGSGRGVPALAGIDGGQNLAPAIRRELIDCAHLVEVLNLDRQLKGASQQDIPLGGVIIIGGVVVGIVVVEWLEEGASLLAYLVEAGVDVPKEGVPLKESCPDQVSVGASVV